MSTPGVAKPARSYYVPAYVYANPDRAQPAAVPRFPEPGMNDRHSKPLAPQCIQTDHKDGTAILGRERALG